MGQVVGAFVPRIETLEKVLGSGQFAADLSLPGLLHSKLRLSDHAHARVLAVDTSEAERLPGVRAVLTAWNTPEYRFGSDFEDQSLLEYHKVWDHVPSPAGLIFTHIFAPSDIRWSLGKTGA